MPSVSLVFISSVGITLLAWSPNRTFKILHDFNRNNLTYYQALWHSRVKRHLVSSCPSFRPSISLPVRPSLLMYQRGSHWTHFQDI